MHNSHQQLSNVTGTSYRPDARCCLCILVPPALSLRQGGGMMEMMQKQGETTLIIESLQLCQQNNHPIQRTNLKIEHQKLDYKHYNHVVSGRVEKPEDYL